MLAPRTARGNRIGLAIVGAILLIGGLYCLGRSQNVFSVRSADRPLLTSAETHFARTHGWFWIAVAAAAVVVALLCVRWLAVQFRRQRVPTFRMEPEHAFGGTLISPGLLAAAVADEIDSYPDVHHVKAGLTGAARHPCLRLDVSLDQRADIAGLRDRIETRALPRLCQALELDEFPVQIALRIATDSS